MWNRSRVGRSHFIAIVLTLIILTMIFPIQKAISDDQMSNTQYAKFYKRFVTDDSSDVYGLKATVKLPSNKIIPSNDSYIIVYLGLGNYECGLSSARKFIDSEGNMKWHWTVGANGDKSDNTATAEFEDAEEVNLQVIIENNKLVYYVNGVKRYTSKKKFYGASSEEARIIVASCEREKLTSNELKAKKLPKWDVFHNQVYISNIKYKNSSGKWAKMTTENSDHDEFNWPSNKPSSAFPDPREYKQETKNGYLYASLKK